MDDKSTPKINVIIPNIITATLSTMRKREENKENNN